MHHLDWFIDICIILNVLFHSLELTGKMFPLNNKIVRTLKVYIRFEFKTNREGK